MAIDASIIGRLQPVQIESPVNALAKILQVQNAQQSHQMNALTLDEKRRGLEESNALSGLYRDAYGADGKIDRNKLLSGAASRGLGAKIPALQKGFADEDKSKSEARKAELEQHLKTFEITGQIMSGVRDQASWDAARQQTAQLLGPDAAARLPAQFDPVAIQTKMRQAMSVKEQMELEHKKLTLAETGRHNRATEGIAGANLGLRREEVGLKRQEVSGGGKAPAGYRWKSDGSLEAIPGGPADPNAAKKAAPTEFQGKASMFGNRAEEADRIITELGGKYSPAAINSKQAAGGVPLVGGALEAGGNLMLSNESQKAEQAQRDFVNAVLRLESGAAIADSEFNNAKKQYFPQPGDADAVIAQKARNRKLAIQGLKDNARRGAVEPNAGGATGDFGDDPLGLRK